MSPTLAIWLGGALVGLPILGAIGFGMVTVFRDFGMDALPGCIASIVGGLAVGGGILLLAWGLTS